MDRRTVETFSYKCLELCCRLSIFAADFQTKNLEGMAFFIDSTLCLMDNGNVSVLGVCLGNTATETIDIFSKKSINYIRERNQIRVEAQAFSKELPKSDYTFILDSNSIVISIYITATPINKEVAERTRWLFREFVVNNNLKSSKEVSITDANNEAAVESGICLIEFHKKEVPILKSLGRDSRFTIHIAIHSRISIYHIPEDVKKAALRTSVSNVLINKKKDVRSFLKNDTIFNLKVISRIALVLYFIGLIAVPFYKVYIEPETVIVGIWSFGGSIIRFILYIIGWWFLYTPACWLIASLFWSGEMGKESRKSCLAHILVLLVPPLIVIAYIYFFNSNKEEKTNKIKSEFYSAKPQIDNSNVYICTGRTAKKYHSVPDCRWLDNCKGTIEEISLEEAEQYGRTPCRGCCE